MRHLLNFRKATFAFSFAIFLIASILPVRAEGMRDRFCVVPVLDGKPTAADVGVTWRMTNSQHRIPGLPSLVFTPNNRQGEWIVDKDRRFSKYVTPFPKSYLDKHKWVREPWSGRVVATNSRNVNVLKLGKEEFESLLLPEELRANNFGPPYMLPETEETLVTSAGDVYVVGERGLAPWAWSTVLKEYDITRPSFYFSKELGATVILNPDGKYSSDSLTEVFVLSGDGKLDALGQLETPNYGVDLVDLEGENSTVLKVASVVARIDSNLWSNGLKKYSIHILHEQIGNGAGTHFAESKLHRTVLQLKMLEDHKTRHSWYQSFFDYFSEVSNEHIKRPEHRQCYRVSRNGLSAIPGGKLPALDKYNSASLLFHEFPESGISLIEAADGFHWFDGKGIIPVPDSSPEIIGKSRLFAGSKSIGRLILRSEKGLFEFMKSGPRPLLAAPFAGPEFHIVDVADWPEANVVLVQTKSGLFALNSDLNAVQIGDNTVAGSRFFSFVGTNPKSGDMILNGEKSLFVVIDTARNGKDICRRASFEPN